MITLWLHQFLIYQENQSQNTATYSQDSQHRTTLALSAFLGPHPAGSDKNSAGYQSGWLSNMCIHWLFHWETHGWLVVWTPLKNMKVNWDDEIPNIWENAKNGNQITNQMDYHPSHLQGQTENGAFKLSCGKAVTQSTCLMAATNKPQPWEFLGFPTGPLLFVSAKSQRSLGFSRLHGSSL